MTKYNSDEILVMITEIRDKLVIRYNRDEILVMQEIHDEIYTNEKRF